VLDAIRTHAPISRAEISRRVGISKPTVSGALRSLVAAGLVRETENGSDRPGYGAIFFEPVPDAALAMGVDIGARFLRGAICDLGGRVLARLDIELAGADATTIVGATADLQRRLLAAAELAPEAVASAVVGVPGMIERVSGRVRLADNVHGLEQLDVGAELTAVLGLPVTVENDVNLAALGEQWRGVGRGVDDFVFLSIGTGLGAGLVLRGELHRGHHGAAGEIDYALGAVDEAGTDPSAPAVSALAARLAGEDRFPTTLSPPFDAPAVFAAARAGDALARAVVDEEARRIAMQVAPIAAVADVGLVVLGGGIGANADLLLAPVRSLLERLVPYPPHVVVSSLGDAAVLTGALALGLRKALDSVSNPVA
jgi:predicted NBD/HSP70 family sugar kinase